MVRVAISGQGARTNFAAVLSQPLIGAFFRNSLILAAGSIAIAYACTMLASFALAKLRLPGREVYFYVILAGLTFPTVALTVPLFVSFEKVGLFNTYLAVFIPIAGLVLPFNVLIARGFIRELPNELFEAARVDGCGSAKTFWYLLLPLTGPLSAVIVVNTFLAALNEYLLPLLFLQQADKQPLTLLPSFFASEYGSDQTKIAASLIVIALPTILVYIGAQRFFERGFTGGSFK
ncbi:MAG: carbohydrate ABC transporter permease [Candidatus Dormibacteraceae bacterium]